MRSIHRKIRRRALLKSLGAASALAPFVPLLNAESEAGGAMPVKRLLLIFTPDGLGSDWGATNAGGELNLSGSVFEPLEPFASKLAYLTGLTVDMSSSDEPHGGGMSALWTGCKTHTAAESGLPTSEEFQERGWPTGPSVDQILVPRIGQETALASLEVAVRRTSPSSGSRMIFSGDNSPINPDPFPDSVFDTIFGGGPSGPISPEELARLRARKQSVLDVVKDDLRRFSSRLGADDQIKLDRHLTGIESIENRLYQDPPSCEGPMVAALDPDLNENFPALSDSMIELVTAALACDQTRIASIQYDQTWSRIRHSWLGGQYDGQSHHALSHSSGGLTFDIHHWYAQQVAKLLAALDASPDPLGQGSVLDNTLVVWGREMALYSHSRHPLPIVIAGGAAGGIPTGGRYLDYGGYNENGHAKMLVSICHAMDQRDINGVGDFQPDSGPLSGLAT